MTLLLLLIEKYHVKNCCYMLVRGVVTSYPIWF